MFGKKTASALDRTARALHTAGTRVAGERGGRTADTIATTVLAPIRGRCNTPCTHTDCDHD